MTNDALMLRAAQLAHEAVEQIIWHDQRRRDYTPDMSVLNAFLDELADE